MATKKQRLKNDFIEAYIRKMGNISKACEEIGIDRKTFYNWLKEPKFKEMYDNAIKKHNDLIYSKIYHIAAQGDKDMMKFWAKTQMKDRGFTEKQELEHSGGTDNTNTLKVEFVEGLKPEEVNEEQNDQ